MSERQVRLLYKTTCRTCGDDVPAGTATWWDDDRRQATCTVCFAEVDGPRPSRASRTTVVAVDERLHRRQQVIRSRRSGRPRAASR